jgi:anti-sigma-K factor RskA
MSDSNEMDELLGAYALDAVSDDERRAVEEYLLANPRARAEVQSHREVATMLAWSGMDAPDGLWDRIASRLEGSEIEPAARLDNVLPMRSRRRSWVRTAGAWAIATAAAAAIAVIAVRVSDDPPSPQSADPVAEVFKNPGSVLANLTSTTDPTLTVHAAIDPDGHGWLQAGSLPALPASRTYQLWGQVEGRDALISLGVLGAAPGDAAFTVEGRVTLLAITEEVTGGVVSSSNPAVVAGAPA